MAVNFYDHFCLQVAVMEDRKMSKRTNGLQGSGSGQKDAGELATARLNWSLAI